MIKRCYSPSSITEEPTYGNKFVNNTWLTFTTFALWFSKNYKIGYHLDKDILIKNNNEYGPNSCIFVPREINNFIVGNTKARELPLGVEKLQNSYRVKVAGNHIGVFTNHIEAHRAWQKAKLEQAIAFNFQPLQRVIDQLTFEIDNNLETISL